MVAHYFIKKMLEQLMDKSAIKSFLLSELAQTFKFLLLAHGVDGIQVVFGLQQAHLLGHLEATRQRIENFFVDLVDGGAQLKQFRGNARGTIGLH